MKECKRAEGREDRGKGKIRKTEEEGKREEASRCKEAGRKACKVGKECKKKRNT